MAVATTLRQEVTELLQELIRIDTTNPPGNETRAAELLRDYLEDSGASWLCEEHPDAVRCDFCINEGSGDRIQLGGKPFYLCSVAEKMSAPFRLRVLGRSGHASMPGIADNALVKAAPLITALGTYEPELQLIPEVEALLETVTGERPATPDDVLERARAVAPLLAELVEPLLSMTLSPTMV